MTGYQPQTYPVKQKVTTCINFEVRGDTKLLYADNEKYLRFKSSGGQGGGGL